ncbi:MAG: hypothetical protein PHS82_14010 [Lachnospiraceae bacterium]|nr:hypothetical protein [Lachnospiraceae bacterium]
MNASECVSSRYFIVANTQQSHEHPYIQAKMSIVYLPLNASECVSSRYFIVANTQQSQEHPYI